MISELVWWINTVHKSVNIVNKAMNDITIGDVISMDNTLQAIFEQSGQILDKHKSPEDGE